MSYTRDYPVYNITGEELNKSELHSHYIENERTIRETATIFCMIVTIKTAASSADNKNGGRDSR